MNEYLYKLSMAKYKMMSLLASVIISSTDAERYKHDKKVAPTMGFQWLHNHIVKFNKNSLMEFEEYKPDEKEEWRTYDFKEDDEGNVFIEGKMLAKVLASEIDRIIDWLVAEILIRYLAECFETFREWDFNELKTCSWYDFVRLIRNAVNHNYRFDFMRDRNKEWYKVNGKICYDESIISKNDENKHLYNEWKDWSPWLMLKLAKEVEVDLRQKIKKCQL